MNVQNTTKKHKIAVVIDSFTRGGVAMAAQVFLQFLAQEHYEITLFVREFDPEKMLSVPEDVVCLPWESKCILSPFNRVMMLLNWRNFGKKKVYRAKERSMFPGEYDCAIAYQMVANDVTVVTLVKIRAKRKVLWLHGKKNFLEKDLPFYDNLYAKADEIVCVSLETEERFRRLMPKCANKTVTIHNLYDIPEILERAALPAEDMDVNDPAVKIVSVGRLSKEKGFDRVPEVARRLMDTGYDFKWYIVGDGDQRHTVETWLHEKQVADRVHLLGHRGNPYPYVQKCDLYVQPSYTEGFCTSTMEAKILHKPVVTTDVPGMREQFVDGENGLIVESSVEGIYDGVRRLLDSPELRARIAEKLRMEPVPNEEVLRQTMAVIDGTKDSICWRAR